MTVQDRPSDVQRDEQRRIALRHVHHMRIARSHARIGVAQELLHRAQVARVQVAQGRGGVP